MHLTLLAVGTRGDVQPVLVLAMGLRDAGYKVRVVAASNNRDWILSHGMEYGEISLDIQKLMQSEEGQHWVESGANPLNEMRIMKGLIEKYTWPAVAEMWDLVQDTDAIISGFMTMGYGSSMAQVLGIPHITAPLQTILATRAGYAISQPIIAGSYHWLNTIAVKITEVVFWQIAKVTINRLHSEILNFPLLDRSSYIKRIYETPTIHGVSRHVLPPPTDWPETAHVAGYWFMDEPDYTPPDDLATFLEAGSPPVYIGFGSMSNRNPQATTRLILDAVNKSGQRAIVLRGWSELGADDLPENVYMLDSAPHTWLFPRMMGIIHHGGAGTTAAGLRSGVPSMVIPHFTDQPYWGRRVHELGVGPRPVHRARLNADRLAAGITAMATDNTMRQNAAELGAKIQAEDGVGEAVRLIGQYLKV